MRGGTLLPIPVLRKLWSIEARGVRFELDDEDVVVGPRRLLDDAALAFITEHKPMLVSILSAEVRL
jgi:hypothetical protein